MRAKSVCLWIAGLLLAAPGMALAGDPPVADAAKRQDKAAVLALLGARADVNARQPDGATALHWAAHWDDLEMADLLLKRGADVNAKNDYDVTPLSLAATNGSAMMVQRLIKAGAAPNAVTATGETPLMTSVRAGSLPVVMVLLAAGADVNAQGGGRDQTALMWAITRKQREIARALIDHGAKLDARSAERPEYVSHSRGNPQGGRLTGLADQSLESDGSRPGLRWVDKGSFTALHYAARDGDLESVQLLVTAGADIDATTGIGNTALMMATRHDQTRVALFLLEKGANPNLEEAGHTALHLAVARRNHEVLNALLAKSATPNIRLTKGEPDPDGNRRYNQLPEYLAGATPYLLAAGLNDLEAMRTLAAAGADSLTPMLDGTTPTMAAMGLFPGVFTFIPFVTIPERGAAGDNTAYFQRKRIFSEEKVLQTVKLTVELGADINAARGALTTYHVGNSRTLVGRDVGDTALHIATADKYPTVVEFLVSKGAKLDVRDGRGLTPLGIAKSPRRQFITGGDNGEVIGNEKMAVLLAGLGATE